MLPIGVRRVLVITNLSAIAQTITLNVGGAAIAGQGIPLLVGSSYQETVSENFEPTNQEVWAISTAATGKLAVYERLLVV